MNKIYVDKNAIISLKIPAIICDKHGRTEHIISIKIKGHGGNYCQICWLESLNKSYPLV